MYYESCLSWFINMCWINWFLKNNLNWVKAESLLNDMNDAIKHRWPDDQGVFVTFCNQWTTKSKTLGVWHVRLSIIDLSPAWHQPMSYKYWWVTYIIVFNGEIYNFLTLKWELINLWYDFQTNTDTEVIIASYIHRGDKCVEKFNWMWAFALYDPVSNQLFCSRDRLGKKPFYYYFDDEQFIFSSEIKWILRHQELNITNDENINKDSIDFYFTLWYIPSPYTIYENIYKLEPRQNLILNINNFELKTKYYYKIPEYKPNYNKDTLVDQGKQLLKSATKLRMFADVPVWAFLSWGLDSSSVVAEMTQLTDKQNLHTFSIWFEWEKYDETKYINIVKDSFWTNHHHKYFKEKDFKDMIDEISYYYDEPFWDYSNFPTMFVSKLAKKHVTVSLSWDGWDEIFWWYTYHRLARLMTYAYLIPNKISSFLSKLIPTSENFLSGKAIIKEILRIAKYWKTKFFNEFLKKNRFIWDACKDRYEQRIEYLLAKNKWDFVQTIIDFDMFYNTLWDNFLVKTDRASMSEALEIRSPFLDHRFIEYGKSIPSKWKTNTRTWKLLMKEIIKDIVPQEIINRWKQWFEPPLDKWILEDKIIWKLKFSLKKLSQRRILSGKIHSFYNRIIEKDHKIYNIYKIRLYLFILWYEKWIRKIS